MLFNSEKKYYKGIDRFELKECCLCLDSFVEEVGIRMLPDCYHIYHTKCIEEHLKFSYPNVKCPLCNKEINLRISPYMEDLPIEVISQGQPEDNNNSLALFRNRQVFSMIS